MGAHAADGSDTVIRRTTTNQQLGPFVEKPAKPTFASPILFSAAWAESTAEASVWLTRAAASPGNEQAAAINQLRARIERSISR